MLTVPNILKSRPKGLQWRASPWFITLGTTSLCLRDFAEQLRLSHTSCGDGYVNWDVGPEH